MLSQGIHLLNWWDEDGSDFFEAEFFIFDSTIDFLYIAPKGCESGYEEMMKFFQASWRNAVSCGQNAGTDI